MTPRQEKAFEFAADAAKQIIALSTAVVGLTVTFLKDVLSEPVTYGWALKLAWLLYFVASAAGLWTILSLTGSLGKEGEGAKAPSIYDANARIPMTIQVVAFLGAIGATVVFGWQQL